MWRANEKNALKLKYFLIYILFLRYYNQKHIIVILTYSGSEFTKFNIYKHKSNGVKTSTSIPIVLFISVIKSN